ncbi:MAG: hypothetical protein PHQ54_05260 [Candidatus Omnitrophica bacterium]|nr:hypothetical protein [Candidatus Omnitrophota bacterium]
MDKIIDLLSNPLTWGALMLVAGFMFKAKRTAYLKLLYLLIQAIEVIDQDIKDIVKGDKEAKLCKIKTWIAKRVGKAEGEVLDDILQNKGLLTK